MNFLLKSSLRTHSEKNREVHINQRNSFKYCSNSISRTKYNPITFLPLFLFEQFRAYTNFFFLLVSIIQQFPEAAFLGRFTTVVPLCIILTISAIKEIIEDVSRHKADKKVNSHIVEVFRELKWSSMTWGDVLVGDIIKVYENDFFAADMLFIESAYEESCICYIDTVNLDGENNLKIRNCVPQINVEPLENFKGVIECDPPNEFIYEFQGLLKTDDMKIPINTSHLLLRGAVLKNTSWVLGVVVYTGRDTKIIKNASTTRLKRSSISILINYQVIILFSIFLFFSFTHWFLYIYWNNTHYEKYWYLASTELCFADRNTFIMVLIFGVLYSIIIPISLPVMQEMSRVIQGIFISSDLDLYDEEKDQNAVVRTSALNEDLGLVKYIFADKTGTLTRNVLTFKKCSVNGRIFSIGDLRRYKDANIKYSKLIKHFFIAMVTGPGVIPVKKNEEFMYFTSSPDQKALILAAKDFGITLVSRTTTKAQVDIRGTREMYEILCEFEFTSERKKSSVIVRTPDGQIIMYVLGSDDVILELSTNHGYKVIVQRHIDKFAMEGLRSICVGMIILDANNFKQWYPIYIKAQEALYNKEGLLNKAEELILKNLILIGCTGVEDELQDGVPETIESLYRAGINIWMLTGDKKETAINIGFSCRLLSRQLPIITLNTTDMVKLRATINWAKRKLGLRFGQPSTKFALVVTGSTLKIIFDSSEVTNDFILLMLSCKAVICCRTTPKQKAEIVQNVQRKSKFVTVAIGDGANDVAMIQTASIGIGISGMEGMQAANSADYSISQFKFLKKLLLVHGTWCYSRISMMVFMIYYKNILLAIIQFIYSSQNAWSGQLYFDRWARMLYNVLLTSLPTLALGILEQNLPAPVLISNPEVYSGNSWFNFRFFWQCLFNAFVHSVILCVVPIMFFWTDVFWQSGLNESYLIPGNIVYTGLIVIICLKCLLHSNFWSNLTVASALISFSTWLVILIILSHIWPLLPCGEDMPRVFEIIFTTPIFYLFIILSVVIVFLYDFSFLVFVSHRKKPFRMMNNLRMGYFKKPRSIS